LSYRGKAISKIKYQRAKINTFKIPFYFTSKTPEIQPIIFLLTSKTNDSGNNQK